MATISVVSITWDIWMQEGHAWGWGGGGRAESD